MTSLHLLRFEYCKGHTLGFSDSSVGKEFTCKVGDTGSIPALGRSAEKVIGYPLQYSGLENSMGTRCYGDIYGWLDKWENPEKEWQPTPVFLPGKSHGQRILVGYSP